MFDITRSRQGSDSENKWRFVIKRKNRTLMSGREDFFRSSFLFGTVFRIRPYKIIRNEDEIAIKRRRGNFAAVCLKFVAFLLIFRHKITII